MKFKKKYLLLFLLPLLSFTAHKYYLSLTQIEYISKTNTVQIITNVFIDDIETALNKKYTIDLQLNTKKELEDSNPYFQKYLTDKLKINIDNQSQEFNFIGKEYDGDIVYFYLEIENISSIKTIEVENKILVESFSNQQNLVKSNVNGKHKSLLLTKGNDKGLLKF